MRVFLIPIIFIRPEYKDDIGLHAHERTHVKQAWKWILPPLHALVYALDDRYRLACEVEAYREQARYSPQNIERFAEFIARDYDLPITKEYALELLNA